MAPPHPAAPPRGKIYLQFEAWNENTNAFETLPQGVPVDLMHYNAFVPNKVLDTQNTDAQGRVEFETDDLKQKNGGDYPNIFYVARTKGFSIGGRKLPEKWSTKGWKARDGQPGYYKEFLCVRMGDVGSPHVFRIGVDFHVRWTYERPGMPDEASTKGLPCTVDSQRLVNLDDVTLHTDEKGEIHGVIFSDIEPGDDISFHIFFKMEDASINLPEASVDVGGWKTNEADVKVFAKLDRTSIGTKAGPEIIKASTGERNVAFYFLKILREWSTFLFHITDHAWTGVPNLTMSTTCPSGPSNAFSWPIGRINIGSKHHWNRGTLVHELSHQVMWKQANISSIGIVNFVASCNLHLIHSTSLLSNPTHALIEGWAEFVEGIFDFGTPYPVSDVFDSNDNRVGPLGPVSNVPLNRGESVEGAFANGLWETFRDYVVGSAGSAHISESANGDITGSAPWIQNADVKRRFKAIIWDPLNDLRPKTNPKTTDFIAKMKSMHPSLWHQRVLSLSKYNMAIEPPRITSVSPASGPAVGGQLVAIAGAEFVQSKTIVSIGGSDASNVIVVNSSSLTCTTPSHGAGMVDVIARYDGVGLDSTAKDAYTYS